MKTNLRAWTVALAGTGINLALGVLYTWSVFASALTEQLGWSKTSAAIPYTVACAVFALMMIPGGRLQDRFGPRWVATAGGLFAGGGLILSSFTDSLFILSITFGLIAGIGIGLGYSAATPAAVKLFPPHKKGLITGIVVAGFGLASLYIAPLTNFLIGSFGVKQAFLIEGLIFFFIIVVLSQFLTVPITLTGSSQSSCTPVSSPTASLSRTSAGISDCSWQEMLRDSRFYLLWLMFAAGAAAGLMIIGQLSAITRLQTGISWGFAMVALLAVFNAGGRVLAGWLSDRIGRSRTMCIFFTMQGINMLAFTAYYSPALIALGAIVTGLSYGSLLSLFPSATYDFYGTKNGGVNYGLVFTAWGAGGVLGPLMAGIVMDMTNSYFYAYLIAASLCLSAAFLTIFLKSSQLTVSLAPPTDKE